MKTIKTSVQQQFEIKRPHSIDLSKPKLTDQSAKKMTDINVIMKNYQATGVLPNLSRTGNYVDNTQIPSLETMFDKVQHARDAFYSLPANLRKLMDNDPSQLEDFILNPENEDLLLKYNLIQKHEPDATAPVVQAAANGKTDSQESKNLTEG